ncbi:MAG: RelA/SpoT protein [uncultured bacterium]|nr:MAG: RelA/SpoT protein [uncultured bacterium]
MKWVELKYSKNQIDKAGIFLVRESLDSVDKNNFFDAIEKLNNWRVAHAFPMQVIYVNLKRNTKLIDKNALIVQRLKRLSSIYLKLKRENGMSLVRMEDIAGCRAIVNDLSKVYELYEILKKSLSKQVIHRERDYIKNPKESGYRGIHLIYKYFGDKTCYENLPVEVQIRSKIQHSWATAVEVVGTFTKQALKANRGEEKWLNFFKNVSKYFSYLETDKKLMPEDDRNNLKHETDDLNVYDVLSAFRVSTEQLTKDKSNKYHYFIIILDIKNRRIAFERFVRNEIEFASERYKILENEFRGDESKDLVLVSAKSLRDLKKSYPNYFADTEKFLKFLKIVIGQFNYSTSPKDSLEKN